MLRSSRNSLSEDLWKDFKQDHAVAVSRHDATHINAELAHHVGGRNSKV